MSLKTVAVAFQEHLKTNNFCDKRVYLVPSRAAMQIMDAYRTPICGIVYAGGEPVLQKQYRAFDVHEFDLFIYQTIYKEELVLVGYTDVNGDRPGVFDLREQALTIVDTFSFGEVFSVVVTDYYGVEDYADRQGLSAVIGLRVRIKEQV